jgi:hypothetical protein
MRRLKLAVSPAVLMIVAAPAIAGPEKVAFPAYQTHGLYTVLDQPDIKELREAYINPEALRAVPQGRHPRRADDPAGQDEEVQRTPPPRP